MFIYSLALAGIIEGSCMRRRPDYQSPPRTRYTRKRLWCTYYAVFSVLVVSLRVQGHLDTCDRGRQLLFRLGGCPLGPGRWERGSLALALSFLVLIRVGSFQRFMPTWFYQSRCSSRPRAPHNSLLQRISYTTSNTPQGKGYPDMATRYLVNNLANSLPPSWVPCFLASATRSASLQCSSISLGWRGSLWIGHPIGVQIWQSKFKTRK